MVKLSKPELPPEADAKPAKANKVSAKQARAEAKASAKAEKAAAKATKAAKAKADKIKGETAKDKRGRTPPPAASGAPKGPRALNQRPPLVLSAKRSTWSADEMLDPAEVKRITDQVMARDQCTCLYCGFQAPQDQELHHLDDDHGNWSIDNLAVICSFCHMSFHVGRAGLMGEAELIWLPEISQPALNHLSRAIFVALRSDDPVRQGADALYAALRARSDDARRRLGTSDPADLGEAMLALTPEAYERRADSLAGLKLLPLGRKIVDDKDVFPEVLERWVGPGGPFEKAAPQGWNALLARIEADALAP